MHYAKLIRTTVVISLLAVPGCGERAPTQEPTPDSVELPSPAAPAVAAEEPNEAPTAALDTGPFLGRWTQADDPTGAIEADPLYAGSFIELGADASYAFSLGGGGSMGPMRGTWEAMSREGDALRYRAVYSGGRTSAPQTLTLRRVDGAIVGLVAGTPETGHRYLVRDDSENSPPE